MIRLSRWVSAFCDLAEHLGDVDMKIEGLLAVRALVSRSTQIHDWSRVYRKRQSPYMLHNAQHSRRLGIGPDPGVVSLYVSALFLWIGGYPDRAYDRAADAIALARKLNHPYSLTYAHFHSGLLNMWLRITKLARDSAEAVLELAETYGFQIWSAIGSCLRGAALVNLGR